MTEKTRPEPQAAMPGTEQHELVKNLVERLYQHASSFIAIPEDTSRYKERTGARDVYLRHNFRELLPIVMTVFQVSADKATVAVQSLSLKCYESGGNQIDISTQSDVFWAIAYHLARLSGDEDRLDVVRSVKERP